MQIAFRGQSVFFSVQFKDEDGIVVTPSAATIRLSYTVRRVVTKIDRALQDAGGGTWTTVWDSGPADAGTIYWWAQSGDPPKSAIQGSFSLGANAANPQT